MSSIQVDKMILIIDLFILFGDFEIFGNMGHFRANMKETSSTEVQKSPRLAKNHLIVDQIN